jgi:hypothetical protein
MDQEATVNPTVDELYNACVAVIKVVQDVAEMVVRLFKTAFDIANDAIDIMLARQGRKRQKRPPKSIMMESQHFFKRLRVHRCRNNC